MLKSHLLKLLAISLLLVATSATAVIKVTVFHKVETKNGVKYIELSVPAHLAHGDYIACPAPCEGGD
jgi:hypothetical protein